MKAAVGGDGCLGSGETALGFGTSFSVSASLMAKRLAMWSTSSSVMENVIVGMANFYNPCANLPTSQEEGLRVGRERRRRVELRTATLHILRNASIHRLALSAFAKTRLTCQS